MRIFGTFVLVFLSFSAISQKRIKIVDSITKVSLSDASITILSNAFKANKKGLVSISQALADKIATCTYVGYKSKTVLLSEYKDGDTIYLSLAIKANALVKVVAQKPLITMTAGKTTMNIASSGLSVGNQAWEILETAPNVRTTDEGSITLQSKSVTVYIDGRSTNVSGDQLKNILSSLPAGTIDRIELISNPSARYQANGAAVINIITKKNVKDGTNGTYTASVGTSRYLRSSHSIDLNNRKGKLNVYGGVNGGFWGNRTLSKNERLISINNNTLYGYEPSSTVFKQQYWGYKLGMDYDISKKSTFGVLINGSSTYRNRNAESTTYLSYVKNQYDSAIQSNTVNKYQTFIPSINLFYKTNIDSTQELIANIDYYKYDQKWSDDFTVFNSLQNSATRPVQLLRDNSPTILDIYSTTLDYTKTLKNGNIQAGAKINFIKTDNNIKWELYDNGIWKNDVLRTNYFIYKENVNAAYIGFSKKYKKVETEAILRAEQTNVKGQSITLNTTFTKNYINYFPSISFLYPITKNNQLGLSYRKSVDRPYYQNVNPFKLFRSQFNYFEGNPDLNPTFTHSIELQSSYKNSFFVTLTYNYIYQFTGTFPFQDTATRVITYKAANYTDANQVSLSLSYNKQIKSYWYTSTNSSVSYFKAAFPGITPKQSTPSANIATHHIFTLKKSKLRMEIYATASIPFHDGFYKHGLSSNCNVAVSKPIMKGKATLRANCTNIFGINNIPSKTEIGAVYMESRAFRDNRIANIAFVYRFGNKNVRQAKQRASKISNEAGRAGG